MSNSTLLKLRLDQDEWFKEPRGELALKSISSVLASLTSYWPRRNRSLLVYNAGSGPFAYNLWRAGFDITAQDDDHRLLRKARESLTSRAEYILAAPDLMPVSDNEYDYSIIPCAMEFWVDPVEALKEVHRITRRGVVFIFFNAFSLHYARYRSNPQKYRSKYGQGPRFYSPLLMRSFLKKEFTGAEIKWVSQLMGPISSWSSKSRFWSSINSRYAPLPIGAVTGVYLSLMPKSTGTALLIPTKPERNTSIAGC